MRVALRTVWRTRLVISREDVVRFEAERMLIGGELVASESNNWDDSINPANEETIGRSPAATKADVNRAVAAAEAAAPKWAALTALERGEILRGFGQKMLERADDLLKVEVNDTGNTITPMRMDVRTAVNAINY